jgi:hypothetical protein
VADELNIPTHRYYQPRYHIPLAKEDISAQYIYDSGIQKIDAHIASLSTTWVDPDVSSLTYDGTKDFGTASATGDICFSDDGRSLYTINRGNDNVFWYRLSTAWDTSTVGALQSKFSFTGTEASLNTSWIKPDGTKVYIAGSANDEIAEYTLSSPYDISTAVYVTETTGASVLGGISALWISPDGTRILVGHDDALRLLTMSTAWDLSTASSTYEVASAIDSGWTTDVGGVWMSQSGEKMYIVDTLRDTVVMYNLGTAWDITTRSSTADVSSALSSGGSMVPRGMFIDPEATTLFIANDGDNELQAFTL